MFSYTCGKVTETFMQSSSIVIAAMLACGGQALADPPNRVSPPSGQSQPAAHEVVLAAAETVRAQPTEAQPAPAPAPHRIARITTCRCGDPQPGDTIDGSSGQ
jgi:hypothetical protein